jgi:uncharacterized membrane protein YheB (UPF0754 family)
MEVGHKMYDYENSREATGLENIGWKFNPHKRVMLQLNDEDLELKKNDIYKKLLSNLGHYEWEEWTSRMLAAAIQNAKAIGAKMVEITSLFQCSLVGWDKKSEYVKDSSDFERQLKECIFEVISEDDKELRVKFKNA